jgi:hypothetical protein
VRALLAFVLLLAAVRLDHVPIGEWGGPHVRLTVRENGASVEFDCAHGTIDEPLKLDEKGRFDAAGRLIPEHMGPVRKDEREISQKARYLGSTDGATLGFQVVPEGGEPIGPFTARLRGRARLVKCR